MKTKFTILTAILFLSLGALAQAPEKINYQAVARDLNGAPLVGTSVNLQFDIIQSSAVIYSETQSLSTNQFGLFTAEIGSGAVVSGTFPTIAWGANPTSLQVTVNGDVMPTTQLLSVPYALYSKESLNGPTGAQGPAGLGINWLGTQTTVPASASLNDAYYNSTDGVAYIYDGTTWQIISQDGNVSGDNWGTDIVNTSGTNILGDGTTVNPIIVIDNDTSKTNELQTLAFNTADSNILEITNGNGVSLSSTTPTVNQVLTWNGSQWVAQTISGDGDWVIGTGNDIYNNTDSVGIGTTNPKSMLQLGDYMHMFPLNMAANEDYSVSTYNVYHDGITLRNTNAGASVISILGDENGDPLHSVMLFPSLPANTDILPINPFPKFNLKGKGFGINVDNPDAALHVSSADSASIMMASPDDGTQATLIYEIPATSEYLSLRAPAFLSGGSYTLTYPSELPSAIGGALVSDLSGNLSWGVPAAAAWHLGGNTGITPGTDFIGTTDNVALEFRTNNANRMTIDAAGNVGIGTGTPSSFAHLNIENSNFDETVRFNNTNTSAGAVATGIWSRVVTNSVLTVEATYGIWNGINNQSNSTTLASSTFANYSFTNNTGSGDSYGYYYKDFSSNSTSYGIFMDNEDKNYFSGDVGIGTTSPGAALHVTPNSTSYAIRVDQGVSGDGILSYVNTTSNARTIFSAQSNVIGMVVKGNGYVGIGTNSPGFPLYVSTSTADRTVYFFNSKNSTATTFGLYAGANGTGSGDKRGGSFDAINGTGTNIGVRAVATGGTTNWAAYFVGNSYTSSGAWTPSDEKLKTEVKHFDGALSMINQLEVKTYYFDNQKYPTMNFSKRKQYGVMAQNLEQIFPEMVLTSDHVVLNKEGKDTDEKIQIKAVNYSQLIPVLVKSIQEQQKMIEELRKEIEALKNKQ